MDANIALVGVFFILMFLGTPIAVALAAAGAIGIVVGLDWSALGTLGTNTYNGVAKYPLIAIPLFILTGMVFERSGVAERLVTFAQAIVGPRRGGLALVAIIVCLIMGGMSGSGPADAAAVATVMLPSMMKAGYPKGFGASVIAASASTAILIPPSIALIVYAVLVPGVDLRALFAAGLIPGLLVGVAIAVPTWLISRAYGFGTAEGTTRPPFWGSFRRALPGLLAPVIILGGLRSGLFTPTETAVVAAAYGLIVGTLLYKTMGLRDVYQALAESAKMSGVLMLIIALAGIFAWAGSTMGAFDAAANALVAFSDSELVTLAVIMVLLLLAGMVLDGVSIYLITLPLLVPVMNAFGWSQVWFGIIMAMNIAIGQFTPPVAVNLMVAAKVAGIPLEATFRWIGWFVCSVLIALLIVICFPAIALWLPQALGYRVS